MIFLFLMKKARKSKSAKIRKVLLPEKKY